MLPPIDQWESVPVSVYEASSSAGDVNAGHRFMAASESTTGWLILC